MKKVLFCISLIALFVYFSPNANAQAIQNQQIDMTVPAMVFFQVLPDAGSPISLSPIYVPTAVPPIPIQASDGSSTWSFRSNSSSTYRLTAQLDNAMPANTEIIVNATAVPVGSGTGNSLGDVSLDNSAKDIVNTITINCGGVITYTFKINDESVPQGSISRTVTWTMTTP